MVVDTSSLLALFWHEAEEAGFLEKLQSSPVNFISACSLVEGYSRVLGAKGKEDADDLLLFAKALFLEIVPFDERQLEYATKAYATFGRGQHPAKLNLGDCFSYALAVVLKEPLLFKGNDFTQTDVVQA